MIAEYTKQYAFRPTIEQAEVLADMRKKSDYMRKALQAQMERDGLIKKHSKSKKK